MSRKSFPLRIDPELWLEIERWAQDDLRSVNGQIEFLLREAVRSRRRPIRTIASGGSPDSPIPPPPPGDQKMDNTG